jgi:predicted  nucleic acid-binding Zn-ribbon protein
MRNPGGIRAMNPSIDALLDLQVIDKRRQALKKAREQHHGRVAEAEKAYQAAETAAATAAADVERMGALIRQYTGDLARCDTTIGELRSKQMNAKTNKEYMAIINGIETAKQEKALREQSVKELGLRVTEMEGKVAAAKDQAVKLKAAFDEVKAATGSADQPGSEELELQSQYDAAKARVDPAFLEIYERLVKANHKMPLMRVDPVSRSTAFGSVISHNQVEQIRMGKLVVDRASNAILYLVEREKPSEAGEAEAKKKG